MAIIQHESTGATNTPKGLTVTPKLIGLPTSGLILYTDENGWVEHGSFAGRIDTVANQVSETAVGIERLTCRGYAYISDGSEYPTVDSTQFRGINCLKFIAPRQYSSFWREGRTMLRAVPGKTGISGFDGFTTSALMKIDPSLSPGYGRQSMPLPHTLPDSGVSGSAAFYLPATLGGNWEVQTATSTFINLGAGTFSDPVGGWHLFTTVVRTNPNRVAKLYIDGVKVFGYNVVGEIERGQTTSVHNAYILNRNMNPMSRVFSGYLAHSAAWIKPLADADVLRYWDTIKEKYGL